MDLKICKRCIVVKPISEFGNSSRTKDKLRFWCRLCESNSYSTWLKNNREYVNKYKRGRRANNESLRLANNLRSGLRRALLRQSTKKTIKTEDLLGISFNECKKDFEFLLTTIMKWNNIELDHVYPLSSFNLTNPNQLKETSLYSYVKPLLKGDNRSKGSKFHEHDIVVQIERVYEYEYFKFFVKQD